MHVTHFGSRHAAALSFAALLFVAACSGAATPSPVAPTPAASSAAPSASAASSASASTAPSASSSAGGSTTSAANAVQIKGFAFNPATITVKVGTSVTWTNGDNVNHTVTDDKGAFDSGAVASGSTFSQTFKTAGTFTYHCKIHPSMTATVVVQ